MLPLAHKGMLKNLPKWLADPLGPLAIPPAYLPKLLPWLIRFWRAGASDRFEASLAAQAGLMKLAEAEWSGLMQRSGTQTMLREDGSLELYESEAEFLTSLPGWAARERFGIEYRHLKQDELAEYQPGLSKQFVRGTFAPGWKTVSDPKDLGKALWRYAEAKGAEFVKGDVGLVMPSKDSITIQLRQGRTILAKQVVIAAGAWSHLLARQLGDRIPLETERGYNTTLPKSAFDVKRHADLFRPRLRHHAAGKRRCASAARSSLAGLQRPPNFQRSKAMLEKAKKFLPGLDAAGGREWMGFRPSLPDSLPVIGRSQNQANVFYAFGHGHLGLTQSAATGRLIRDLVLGQAAAIDLQPFSAQRF